MEYSIEYRGRPYIFLELHGGRLWKKLDIRMYFNSRVLSTDFDKPSQDKDECDEVNKGELCVEAVDGSVHQEDPALL